MNTFSLQSLEQLVTCHLDLQRLAHEALKVADFSVLEGHRGEAAQEKAFVHGPSRVHWPDSKHNSLPSLAFDLAPYPLDWNNWRSFYFLAGVIKGIASQMGIGIRWGGDWNNDGVFTDQRFNDLPHFELIEKKKDETLNA